MNPPLRRRIVLAGTLVWAASLGVLVIQAFIAYPTLPETVASHFDGRGRPNDQMSKAAFHVVWFLAVGLVGVIPLTIGPVLRSTHPSLVNLPRKDYWLSTPERTREAAAIMRGVFGWILVPLNCILFLVYREVVAFHRTGRFEFPLAIFGVGIALIVVVAVVLPWFALLPTLEEAGGEPR